MRPVNNYAQKTHRDHKSWVSHVGSPGSVACLLKASLWHFCLRGASTGPNPLEERAVKSAIGMSSLTSGFAIWLSNGCEMFHAKHEIA